MSNVILERTPAEISRSSIKPGTSGCAIIRICAGFLEGAAWTGVLLTTFFDPAVQLSTMPGGVCAVLDYEVELMSDYVSEMATRIVLPQKNVNSAFRKFVSQILSSTRLPSTTILLGMNYLAKRINMMHVVGHTHHTEGQVWRMVTVALLLGSKFLDDNTFQNKSWSEVSGIPVQELNTLEHEWLGANNWCLYVNLDESKDYNAWLANWKEWLETRQSQQAQAARGRMASLSPIDTEVGRPRKALIYSSWHQQQVAEMQLWKLRRLWVLARTLFSILSMAT
ncbi:hypothetical protein P8C59_006041 [Phyllachora maydis]|uniref:Uncharacterized protein n=1 Tax=Phyllachora maydis TaxID=1825666 RepID=A0AAD9I6S0_9PEZI|nr:hypothetical protein P8C59_006041 [Phyllachora maydis]